MYDNWIELKSKIMHKAVSANDGILTGHRAPVCAIASALSSGRATHDFVTVRSGVAERIGHDQQLESALQGCQHSVLSTGSASAAERCFARRYFFPHSARVGPSGVPRALTPLEAFRAEFSVNFTASPPGAATHGRCTPLCGGRAEWVITSMPFCREERSIFASNATS